MSYEVHFTMRNPESCVDLQKYFFRYNEFLKLKILYTLNIRNSFFYNGIYSIEPEFLATWRPDLSQTIPIIMDRIFCIKNTHYANNILRYKVESDYHIGNLDKSIFYNETYNISNYNETHISVRKAPCEELIRKCNELYPIKNSFLVSTDKLFSPSRTYYTLRSLGDFDEHITQIRQKIPYLSPASVSDEIVIYDTKNPFGGE